MQHETNSHQKKEKMRKRPLRHCTCARLWNWNKLYRSHSCPALVLKRETTWVICVMPSKTWTMMYGYSKPPSAAKLPRYVSVCSSVPTSMLTMFRSACLLCFQDCDYAAAVILYLSADNSSTVRSCLSRVMKKHPFHIFWRLLISTHCVHHRNEGQSKTCEKQKCQTCDTQQSTAVSVLLHHISFLLVDSGKRVTKTKL